MIAVSQNLTNGLPLIAAGVGATAPENDNAQDGGFLQAFIQMAAVCGVVAVPKPESSAPQAKVDKDVDQAEDQILLEPAAAAIENWLPIAPIPSFPQIPVTQVVAIPPVNPSSAPFLVAEQASTSAPAAPAIVQGVGELASQSSPFLPSDAEDAPKEAPAPTAGSMPARPADQVAASQSSAPAFDPKSMISAPIVQAAVAGAMPTTQVPQTAMPGDPQSDPSLNAAEAPPPKAAPNVPTYAIPLPKAERPERPQPAANTAVSSAMERASTAANTPPVSTAETAWRQKWVGDVQIFAAQNDPSATGAIPLQMADSPSLAAVPVGQEIRIRTDAPTPPNPHPSVDMPKAEKLQRLLSNSPPRHLPPTLAPSSDPVLAAEYEPDAQIQEAVSAAIPQVDGADFGAAQATPLQTNTSVMSPTAAPIPNLPAALTPAIVEMSKSGNDGPLEMALSPEELGRLTISIKQDGSTVHVTLTADRPETLDLLRRHGNDLVADLRQAGFSGASLSFGQGGQGQHPRFAQPEPASQHQPSPTHLPPETKPTAPSRALKGSGMDLRL